MTGITRIHINSTWKDSRTELSRNHESAANELYCMEFARLNMPLADGLEEISCTKDEALARYDWREGIDVILTTARGTRITLQEKVLTYKHDTATFEERKTSGALGAWYYCTAQYYFVGYDRTDSNTFCSWILLDLPAVHRADELGLITWEYNVNCHDNRRASFRYVHFNKLPQVCVVARGPTGRIEPRQIYVQEQLPF